MIFCCANGWFRNDPQDNFGRRPQRLEKRPSELRAHPHACSAPGRSVKNIGYALEHTTRLFSDCENSGYFKVLFPPNRMLERTGTTLSFTSRREEASGDQ
jgi:hypothetical protein